MSRINSLSGPGVSFKRSMGLGLPNLKRITHRQPFWDANRLITMPLKSGDMQNERFCRVSFWRCAPSLFISFFSSRHQRKQVSQLIVHLVLFHVGYAVPCACSRALKISAMHQSTWAPGPAHIPHGTVYITLAPPTPPTAPRM